MSLSSEDVQTLATELFGGDSPLAGAYATIEAGPEDEATRNDLLAQKVNSTDTNRTIVRGSMGGNEVFEATDATDYAGLADAAQQKWLTFCSFSSIDPSVGGVAETFVKNLFGNGTNTVSNLATLRLQTVSRAAEIGLPEVNGADVGDARLVTP